MPLLQRTLERPREETGLSRELELDLSRLKTAAAALGETRATLGLQDLGADAQLHQINRYFGARLNICRPRERMTLSQVFADADAVLPVDVRQGAGHDRNPEATHVRQAGCADLGRTLNDEQVREIHAHLRSKPLLLAHDAHVGERRVQSLDDVPKEQNYACYDYLDLWSSPHILELAAQERILNLAQGYLGCTPTLYSINAFWSFPGRQAHEYTQVFHRDWEDYRSLVIFTLLTPIEVPEDGAHYYVETSHEVGRLEASLRQGGIDADVEALSGRGAAIAPLAGKLFEHTARRFDGPAGQSFCADGYGLHRALVPRARPRLLLWMRFGNFFNETAYKIPPMAGDPGGAQRVLRRIPAAARHQYVFRYLVEALNAAAGA